MKFIYDYSGGYKIRLHRIIFQLIIFTLIVKLFGWWSLMLTLIVLASEFVPYLKLDEVANPWYKRWLAERKAREERELAEHYSDLSDFCPNCRQKYDERDREFQICHLCGHINNPEF